MSDSRNWVQVCATKGRRWEDTASFRQVSSFMAMVSSCLKDSSSRSTASAMERQSLQATSALAMFSSPCCQKKSDIFCLFSSTAHTSSSLNG
ncbi:hypothetical protein EYF80_045675 [Liparis tanakae]|uniref:Uncharacterized protein n=1 Tax=Liparis tanakae TaxID=230148 RepID=A0A4Z2FTR7_9TELE|nr:hypothetical protein EYF80_045675 [Liparis tanakae]